MLPTLFKRPRRLRGSEAIRSMVRENYLAPADLISPIFVINGIDSAEPIASMPDVFRLTVDRAVAEAGAVAALGIPAVLLFGIPNQKDARGSAACDPSEAVQRAVAAIKNRYPDLLVITDVCLCEYTDHGHCGLVKDGLILNDESLPRLAEIALSHVRAGADMVAPSDMMDGRVAAIRSALDDEGFTDRAIISYAVKYASAFYGPFREAASSAPQFGCRRTYQMDPANVREALREAALDLEEGADMIMVKPALSYLDVIKSVREAVNVPVVTYNVSGEYAMVKAAAQKGWIDEERVVLEQLLSVKRAGADLIITYHAKDVAGWLQRGADKKILEGSLDV
ncbi:MAG: porphobilinogen synthase [Dethiobacteria bacterium]|nr:porphobilinogen synthase [Dethiobacteria bacterium]